MNLISNCRLVSGEMVYQCGGTAWGPPTCNQLRTWLETNILDVGYKELFTIRCLHHGPTMKKCLKRYSETNQISQTSSVQEFILRDARNLVKCKKYLAEEVFKNQVTIKCGISYNPRYTAEDMVNMVYDNLKFNRNFLLKERNER